MIKQTCKTLTSLMLLVVSSVAFATDLESSMKNLAQNYQAALKAATPESFSQRLQDMRAAAVDAQGNTPPKLQGQSADSKDMQEYRYGLGVLVGQIDMALELAGEGKLEAAKALAGEFAVTRDAYHKKFR